MLPYNTSNTVTNRTRSEDGDTVHTIHYHIAIEDVATIVRTNFAFFLLQHATLKMFLHSTIYIHADRNETVDSCSAWDQHRVFKLRILN